MTESGRPADAVPALAQPSRRLSSASPSLWAFLPPLLLLFHPYGGLIQDARIYIGRAVADHDPMGVGRDIVFADDAQTGFTLTRPLLRVMLDIVPPGSASMLLALAGSLLWLAAAVALLRQLAPARAAWAAAIAILALPAGYGAFDVFDYGETIATPRVFAEAAVLGGLATLVGGRRVPGLALMALALLLHPLMALPGLAIAAVLLVSDDRRWLLPMAAAVVAVVGAALLKLPLAGRLFEVMDPAWLSILRQRCLYLFPTLWPGEAVAHPVSQAAAAVLAGSFMPRRQRALMWGATGIAAGGVTVSLLFGDLLPGVLVTQLQPWRALWPLAVLGNAALVLAALDLWQRGGAGRLALALLIMAWWSGPVPVLSIALSAAAVLTGRAARLGQLATVTPRVWLSAMAGAALVALQDEAGGVRALLDLWASARAQDGDMSWRLAVGLGVQSVPFAIGAVVIALRPATPRPATLGPRTMTTVSRFGAVAVAAGWVAASLLWDGRTAERRMIESASDASAVRDALGPATGEVLWIDVDAETWFMLGRPAFFEALQGAPILFSREMALDWADRARTARGLGLARAADLAPWTTVADDPAQDLTQNLPLSSRAVEAFCADPRHPAGLVAPGAQRAAVPTDLKSTLWRPASPVRRLVIDGAGPHWRRIDVFTVVRCSSEHGEQVARPR